MNLILPLPTTSCVADKMLSLQMNIYLTSRAVSLKKLLTN